MDNEDVIREQMEDTRTSLTEKLENLEQEVATTVQGATTNVADTVEAVKETVEAVKDSVQETVATVKYTVQDTVATVKDTVEETISTVKESVQEGWCAVKNMFDIPSLVNAHPCAMFAGSVAVGFALETLLVPTSHAPGASPSTQGAPLPPDHYSGEDRFESVRPAARPFAGIFKTFEPEINRLKGLALGAVMNSIRDMVVTMVPEHMAPKLSEVFHSFTQKLGGEVVDGQSAHRYGQGEHGGNGRSQERASQES
jgi:hypothetical protein